MEKVSSPPQAQDTARRQPWATAKRCRSLLLFHTVNKKRRDIMFLSFVNHVVAFCVLIVCCIFLLSIGCSLFVWIKKCFDGYRAMKAFRKNWEENKE